MPMTQDQLERYVDAAAAAIDLPLDPQHRPGVIRYVALAASLADALKAVPLVPHDDPAERFEPIGPDDLSPSTATEGSAHG